MRCRENKMMSKRRPEMVLEKISGPSCKQIEESVNSKMIGMDTRLSMLTNVNLK